MTPTLIVAGAGEVVVEDEAVVEGGVVVEDEVVVEDDVVEQPARIILEINRTPRRTQRSLFTELPPLIYFCQLCIRDLISNRQPIILLKAFLIQAHRVRATLREFLLS
jgi:hypothetical protein